MQDVYLLLETVGTVPIKRFFLINTGIIGFD